MKTLVLSALVLIPAMMLPAQSQAQQSKRGGTLPVCEAMCSDHCQKRVASGITPARNLRGCNETCVAQARSGKKCT